MSPGSDPLSNNHSPRAARRGHGGASSASSPPTAKQASHDGAAISTLERSDRSPPISTSENASTSSDAPPPPPPPSDGPEHVINGNGAGKGKKPAWNMPSNGASEVGPVMGAVSWPPLSVSIKASSKSSSSDSLKNLSDGSIAAPQGSVVTSSAPNLNSTRLGDDGGGGALANGGSPPPQSPPALVETDKSVKEKQSIAEPSLKEGSDLPSKSSNSWDHGPRGGGYTSRHHGGGNYHRAYGGGRRGGNSGGGGGGYGNRREYHARGGYDWNSHRNYSDRDAQPIPQQQQQWPPPPPASMPFVGAPTPVPPFSARWAFLVKSSYPMYLIPQHLPVEQLRNMSYAPHQVPPAVAPQVFHSQADLQHLLMRQIDYYFSPENLCKDVYLRQQMDDQGWVRLSVIANFNKVKQLTSNIQLILEAVRGSTVVEVQGMRIRRRIDWRNWILPPFSNQYGTTLGPQSSTQASPDYLAGRIYGVRLEEGDEGASNSSSTTGQNPT
ncbi:la-related protein 1C-like [Typha latifolia]|uniref:la-related protein 1C-like n=1 Tax=Typha latifolia TaxID=4733 RepID=UPI003C2B5D04